MIQTAIIYTILWLLLYFALSNVETNVNHYRKEDSMFWNWGVVSVLIIACLVKGLSEDMGTDYYTYAEAYNRIANSASLDKDYEVGYLFLNKVLAFFGMDLPWIFIVNSFIVFFSLFFFASIIRENIAYAIVLFIFIFYIQSNNLWRQYDAMSFMLISMGFLVKTCTDNKKISTYYCLSVVFALLAVLFHSTSVVYVFIFYGLWMVRKRQINVWVIVGLITLSFIYAQVFVERSNFVSFVSTIGFLGYEEIYTIYDKFEEYNAHSALSESKDYLFHVISILMGDYILRKNGDNEKLRFFFYVVAFYFILYPFVRYHSLVMRILMYAQLFVPFYYGMVYYFLRKKKKQTVLSTLYLLCICLITIDYMVDFYNIISGSTETLRHGYKLYGM